ncbi:hypothetical protein Q9966_006669 [Columba livia]|nr:hypothetical protein Q9966_006669 [Columba livia]
MSDSAEVLEEVRTVLKLRCLPEKPVDADKYIFARVYSMAQTEKKGGLLRKSSASKKPLKEKVVLMYDEIFMTEDPSKCNPRFWEELFLMKVNLEYLEGKLEALDGEELMKIKDNINCLFQHCIQALGEEHPIRVVNALQTLCALIRGVHQKNKSTSGFDIINMLVGFDKAELCMKNLMESLDSLLCAEGSESLKSLCLKLLLCLVTVTDNISQNTILEYVMINSIFEAILQILSSPLSRREHGYDAVVLLALLVNYRKYEAELKTNFISSFSCYPEQSVNPYIVKLSIVDDEATLNGMGLVITQALSEYNRQYKDKEEEHQSGFFSALTNMVGSMFIADADEKISVQTNEAILLALYEAVHLNRNFITVLAQVSFSATFAHFFVVDVFQIRKSKMELSHPEMGLMTTPTSPIPVTPVTPLGTTPPSSDVISSAELPLDADGQTSNLLITFLKYSSIVMQDTKDEHRLHSGKLCLIILTCIAEDQYANAFLHDDNMNFRVNLHRMPMRHRKKAADKNLPCRPLVCAVLDLMVEFIVTHMMKEFPMDLYVRCIQIVHKLLCYQKKCRVRLHYTWRELWSALINLLKFLMSNETVLLAKHNIFTLALMVVNLFNMFITYGDTFLPTPSSYDELYYEIIRMHQNFDNLYSMVLRLSTNAGQWKEPASKVTHALVNIRTKLTKYLLIKYICSLRTLDFSDGFGYCEKMRLSTMENVAVTLSAPRYYGVTEMGQITLLSRLEHDSNSLAFCCLNTIGTSYSNTLRVTVAQELNLNDAHHQEKINRAKLCPDRVGCGGSCLLLELGEKSQWIYYLPVVSNSADNLFNCDKSLGSDHHPLDMKSRFVRAIINHFNPKIESYAAVNHISQLSEDQVLEVVRSNYDTLTLKLQDGLDQYERYSEQHKEAAFFKELVRSISINVRKNLAFNTLSQELLLKEFSTIS